MVKGGKGEVQFKGRIVQFYHSKYKLINVKNQTGQYPGMGSGPTKNRGQEGVRSGQTYELGIAWWGLGANLLYVTYYIWGVPTRKVQYKDANACRV